MARKNATQRAIDDALKAVLPYGSAIIIAVRLSPSDDTYHTEIRGTGDPALWPQMLDDASERLLPDTDDDPEPDNAETDDEEGEA